MNATISTLRDQVDAENIRDLARNKFPLGSAHREWRHVAANHWPEPLAYIEHVFAISTLETYAQGVLFALYMAKEKVTYEEYSKNWKIRQKSYRKWKGPRSTQNIRSLKSILSKEFGIVVQLDEQKLKYLENANENRNKIIHNSGHLNVTSSQYQASWNKPNHEAKIFLGEFKVGKLPEAVYTAIEAIDKSVLKSGILPPEVLMHTPEIENG